MQLNKDVDELVRSAQKSGRGAFTFSGFLRINLHRDPKKGWVLVAIAMQSPMQQALGDGAAANLRMLSGLVGEKIRTTTTGTSGGFGEPVVHWVGGQQSWTFVWSGSPGEAPAPPRPDRSAIEKLVRWARANPDPRKNAIALDGVTTNGWKLCLSCENNEPRHTSECWHFSASLYPGGRSSTSDDWRMLGQLTHAVQAALGHADARPTEITRMDETHPNAVQHFCWHPDGSACPLEEEMRAVARAVQAGQGWPKNQEAPS